LTIDAELPDTSGVKAPEVSLKDDVVLKDVWFSYPSRPKETVLKGLSVRFEAKKVTAIVGPSGSGKSTIVGLLERWYDVSKEDTSEQAKEQISCGKDGAPRDSGNEKVHISSGSITIGDIDLNKTDLKWWRSQIGLVQQEPFLFNDTIYNNVAYGLCGTQWHDTSKEEKLAMVQDACKEAYADEFISKLPQVRIKVPSTQA
jgi:ATP-binding cassette, subfamily B (MDR/TAP), member 1